MMISTRGRYALRVMVDLAEHFEVLHTQSRQWIIEEIDEFIKERKESYK